MAEPRTLPSAPLESTSGRPVVLVESAKIIRMDSPGTTSRQDPPWQDAKSVRFMLDYCDTWAVVGLSGDPTRTAYAASTSPG